MLQILICLLVSAAIFFGADWILLPAWNLRNPGFLVLVIISVLIGAIIADCIAHPEALSGKKPKNSFEHHAPSAIARFAYIMYGIAGISFLALIVGLISSATPFNVDRYNSVIAPETKAFSEVLAEEENVSNIAIMDTETATIIGKRAMGSVADLVSQYEVSEFYSTICYKDAPVKVANLEYGGIFKYFTNKETGIPGYILVDPVKNTAQYIALSSPIRYCDSAVFSEDLMRHIRGTYKTEMIEGKYFELDEEGNPWWICPVRTPIGGLFGGSKIDSVILVNACDGKMEKLAVSDVPAWVDRVYDGDLLCEYYDDYGKLQNGFWNSLFGQKGCVMTTEDYGYKIMDGDVWVYTGVTSVASDESNIGFVLMNQRTMETTYFACSGAEEFSAMSAAEGTVQDLGYAAAFPSLINVSGVPTYIMCLKDGSGLVKMYAMVNVEQYNMVGTGNTQAEALKNYKAVLAQNNINIKPETDETLEKKIEIERIDFLNVGGESVCYITADGEAFKQVFEDNEALILLKEGDKVTVTYTKSETEGINNIVTIK